MSQIYVAKNNAFIEIDGVPVNISGGRTLAREGHPILDSHGDLFELAVIAFDVEDAKKTATPPKIRQLPGK